MGNLTIVAVDATIVAVMVFAIALTNEAVEVADADNALSILAILEMVLVLVDVTDNVLNRLNNLLIVGLPVELMLNVLKKLDSLDIVGVLVEDTVYTLTYFALYSKDNVADDDKLIFLFVVEPPVV